MRYKNFDLSIDDANGRLRAHARFGDLDGRADIDLSTWSADLARHESNPTGTPREDAGNLAAQVRSLGDRLFRAVFRDEVLECWHKATGRAGGEDGIRIRLHLNSAGLAHIPWELIGDSKGRYVFGVSPQFPVSRRLNHSRTVLKPAGFPLRVLICDSVPENLSQLEVQREVEAIQKEWIGLEQQGDAVIERLQDATVEGLLGEMRRSHWHILHFIGHGTANGLYFRNGSGKAQLIEHRRWCVLGQVASNLRLVVLNCCDSATSSPGEMFSSVAEELNRIGVPAVVGMRRRIDDRSAVVFARWFYRELASGSPVDTSASASRSALFLKADEGRYERPEAIWASPVVYMSRQDGQIIDWESKSPPPEDLRLVQASGGSGDSSPGLSALTDKQGGQGFPGFSLRVWAAVLMMALLSYFLFNVLDWSGDPNRPSLDPPAEDGFEPGSQGLPTQRGPEESSGDASSSVPSDSRFLPHLLFQGSGPLSRLFAYCMKDVDPQLGRELAERHRQGTVVVYKQCLKASRADAALLYLDGKRTVFRASPDSTGGRKSIQKLIDASSGRRSGAICWDGQPSEAEGAGACSQNGGVMHWAYADRDASVLLAEICSGWTLVSASAGGCSSGRTLAQIYNRDY